MEYAFSMDDARRARAEKQGEAQRFEWRGEAYELPVEMPFAFSEAIGEGQWRKAVTILLDGQADTFFDGDPPLTNKDLEEFAEGVAKVYTGATPGESPASHSRSRSTTKSSRPRSKRTTS